MEVLLGLMYIFMYIMHGAIQVLIPLFFFISFIKRYARYKKGVRERFGTLDILSRLILSISYGVHIILVILFIGGIINHVPALLSGLILILFSLLWHFYNIAMVKKLSSVMISLIIFLWSIYSFFVFAASAPALMKGPWNIYEQSLSCADFRFYIEPHIKGYITKHNCPYNKEITISWDDLEKILTIYYPDSKPPDYEYDLKGIRKSIIRDHNSEVCPYYLLNGKLYCKIHDKPK